VPVPTGTLRLIVRRPGVDEREIVEEARLDPVAGLVGDTWGQRSSSRTADGGPHPDMQLNVMNWHAVAALADTDEERALAGDQLYVDLSLRDDDLPAGTRLAVGAERGGTAVIVVTDQPHRGCDKFLARFGEAAVRWVNGLDGRELHLRGINARVERAGVIRTGDTVAVLTR
jgi:MOSC domain-containing protein YiiM